MNARLRRIVRTHARLACVLGLALLAGACERALPTDAEIERMDVAALEARAVLRPGAQVSGAAPNVTYFLDDQPISAEVGRTMTGDRIVRLVMHGGPDGPVFRLYSATAADAASRGTEPEGAVRFRPDENPPLYGSTDVGTGETRMTTPERFSGLLVVDGVVTDRAGLARLRPEDIDRVEVIRGVAAARRFTDPRARNGAVVITTRTGSR